MQNHHFCQLKQPYVENKVVHPYVYSKVHGGSYDSFIIFRTLFFFKIVPLLAKVYLGETHFRLTPSKPLQGFSSQQGKIPYC